MPTPPTLDDLKAAARDERKVRESARLKLVKRDQIAADLAESGTKYQSLADAMGIGVDGVTYVLRKVRRGRASE